MSKRVFLIVILLAAICCLSLLYLNSWRGWRYEREHVLKLKDSAMQKKIKNIRDSAGAEIQLYTLENIRVENLLQSSSIEVQNLRSDLDAVKLKLKNVRSSVSVVTETEGKSVIEVNDTMVIDTDTSCMDKAEKIVSFADSSDAFLKIAGNARFRPIQRGFVFSGIEFDYSILDSFQVTHALKGGIFNRQQMELMVKTKNPKSTIKKVQSYYITVPKKWYQKWYVSAGAGVIGGVWLAGKIIK